MQWFYQHHTLLQAQLPARAIALAPKLGVECGAGATARVDDDGLLVIEFRVELEVAVRPSELLNAGSMPEISQWWQYIALGSALKLLYDRTDVETIAKIMPEFKQQELLVI